MDISEKNFDRAYKIFSHGDNLYHQRINFFLVAESMLVISYVTSFPEDHFLKGIGQGICMVGLIFTTIWLYTNARLGYRVIYMIQKYLKGDLIYDDYIDSAKGLYSKTLLTYALPVSMNLLWLYFLCLSLSVDPWFCIIESFLIMIALSIWMDKYHIPKRIFHKDQI